MLVMGGDMSWHLGRARFPPSTDAMSVCICLSCSNGSCQRQIEMQWARGVNREQVHNM